MGSRVWSILAAVINLSVPVLTFAMSVTLAAPSFAAASFAAPQPAVAQPAATRSAVTKPSATKPLVTEPAVTKLAAGQTQQDEYARIELQAPETASFTMTLEVAVTTPGAKDWVTPLPSGRPAPKSVTVLDMMTGQPLKHVVAQGSALRVTLARPITGEGGQARVRVTATISDPRGYRRVRADDDEVMFSNGLVAPRSAIVLPAGYRLTQCNLPSQVLTLADGRTQVSFMHQGPAPGAVQVGMKPGALTGDAAKPRPLTNARSWEPPPAQGPSERARLSERAAQDRDIVYFLQPPDTHAFSLYHDYTESREGSDKYLNVVRTGSKVSAPSGVVLDTGEAMKVEVLKGAQLAAAGIDAGGAAAAGAGQVASDQEVVVFRYPAVKPGESLRLRLSETYTAPESYRLDGDDLVFERSLGRPRNSVVLPKGWYLTALSIPGVIRQTPGGETRIDFVNPRPDGIDVLLKGRKFAK
jgi:hypothetical protein